MSSATSSSHFGPSPDFITQHRSQHPDSRTILVTGATAGIGLAIADHLSASSARHLLILTGRKADVLRELHEQNPNCTITKAGDMADPAFISSVIKDLHLDGRLDGVILNHGTLGECHRIADTEIDEWERTFRINVSSCVGVIKQTLPLLRASKGRVVFTSSGAASNAYSSWGAYGASKAAINHLAMTLKNEEPEITAISVRPGVVDTAMQADIRDKFLQNMDVQDQTKFGSAKRDGKLLPPDKPGRVIAELAVRGAPELSGMFLSWDDPKLAEYQSN